MPADHKHTSLVEAQEVWPCPQKSCGRDFHDAGGTHFWDAVGPAACSWLSLNPALVSVVEDVNDKTAFLSIHFAMVGPSKELSSPKILICSKHPRVQAAMRDEILARQIMAEYPGIGIDACTNPPVPLALDMDTAAAAVAAGGQPPRASMSVWSPSGSHHFGRQIRVAKADGTYSIATGGITFFDGDKSYQLTSIHDKIEAPAQDETTATVEEDAELCFETDDESLDGDSISTPPGAQDETTAEFLDADITGSNLARPAAAAAPPSPAAQSQIPTPGKILPAGSVRIGEIVRTPSGLDYALIELQSSGGRELNRLTYGLPGGVQRVFVNKVGRVADKGIVVVTNSSLVDGILSAAPQISKSAGQDRCQKIYAIKVDGSGLQAGDSGSTVVDMETREVLGHVICGHSHTNIAYMLAIEDIIEDIAERHLLEDFRLEPKPRTSFRKPNALPNRVRRLMPQRWASSPTPSSTRAAENFDVSDRIEFSSPQYYIDEMGQEMPKQRIMRELVSGAKKTLRNSLRSDMQRSRVESPIPTPPSDFLSLLPPELRNLIVRELPPKSAWRLRQVSRAWRASVTINANAISNLFISRHPLPPLALRVIGGRTATLDDIEWVRHGHDLASRLAICMSKWMCVELYRFTSIEQRRDFKANLRRRLQQRLMAPLFSIFYFLEKYPFLLLDYLNSRPAHVRSATVAFVPKDPHPFELAFFARKDILDDKLLGQTNQTIQIVTRFVRFILGPPSYSVRGRIRSLHHQPLPERAAASLLCVGGLNAIVRFAEMSNLEDRREAIDGFYGSLTSGHVEPANADLTRHLTSQQRRLIVSNLHLNPGERWKTACEWTLLKRLVFEHRAKIPGYAQALTELIRPPDVETNSDVLYRHHELWHALVDRDFGGGQGE